MCVHVCVHGSPVRLSRRSLVLPPTSPFLCTVCPVILPVIISMYLYSCVCRERAHRRFCRTYERSSSPSAGAGRVGPPKPAVKPPAEDATAQEVRDFRLCIFPIPHSSLSLRPFLPGYPSLRTTSSMFLRPVVAPGRTDRKSSRRC